MAVKASAREHKCSCWQSTIPVVTTHRVNKLTLPLFQRYGTGTLMWSGRLEIEVGRNRKRFEAS